MPWTFHPALRGLEERRSVWDGVNSATFSGHPLLDGRFVLPLVRYFGGERTVLASFADDQGHQEGALLLEPRRTGFWQTFLPSQAQIAPVVLSTVGGGALRELMAGLPGSCWLLDLLNQDSEYSCFRGVLPANADQAPQATTMRIAVDSDFSNFWRTRRKHLRENVRRYFKRTERDGIVTALRTLCAPGDVLEALRRYGDLESRGWKGAAGTAVHAENIQGLFYGEVLSAFSARGQATVYELLFDNRVAASRLCIGNHEMLVMLKTTYDERRASYAPGRLLLYLLLESEFNLRRYRVIEFYTNATRETLEWGSESRIISNVSLYRHQLVQEGVRLWRRTRTALSGTQDANVEEKKVSEDAATVAKNREDASHSLFERISSYEAFLALEPEWKRCCDLDGYASIFLTHLWFENFIHEVVLNREELAIYVARTSSREFEAIFPMMISRATTSKMGSRSLTFLANYYTPVAKPIWAVSDARKRVRVARSFLHHLLETDRDWDLLNLTPLPEETPDFDVLDRALEEENLAHTSYVASVNWFQPTEQVTSTEYTARLPSRVRNTIRRRSQRAERKGTVDVRVFRGVEEVQSGMDDYYVVYARSWKRPEPYPTFHRRLAEKLAARSEVLLGVLYFEERPVAAQIWVVHERVASILKLCYDEAFREYSFGTLLTHRLMAFVIDEVKVTTVDYLSGDDAYKKDWMTARRTRRGILAFNRSARGRLLALSELSLKPVLKHASARLGMRGRVVDGM